MRTVQVYIEGQRLDLFEDEQINVTSTQQNVQDISKVFTDFSQSFSVPASVKNNEIFHHFYENDIDSTLDFNTRRNGNIEIDYTPFRTGKISLEKAEVKNNQAYSYQITFYGDVVSLKDKFAEDKLVDLTLLNIYAHPYTAAELKNRITDGTTNYVVRYPLIAPRRLTYGDGGSNDINTNTGAIKYTELFPAIRIAAILGAMQGRYGITFNGTFLTDKRFQNAFLYCMNANNFQYFTSTEDINIATLTDGLLNENPLPASAYFDTTENTVTYDRVEYADVFPTSAPGNSNSIRHRISTLIYNSSVSSAKFFIDVFVNNVFLTSYEALNNQLLIAIDTINAPSLQSRTVSYRVRANINCTFEMQTRYQQISTASVTNLYTGFTPATTLAGDIDPLSYIPDMKVSDFFSGLLKQFNLTCYGTSTDVYQLEPLSDWYAKGAVVNITEYTDIESTNIDRVKLYKNIEFNYEESENILNQAFRDLFSRNYGDVTQQFNYDGGEFKVELPFENMMQERFTGTDLQVGFTIDHSLNTYVPKPMVLYMYDETVATFKFFNGTTTDTITEYMPFGQDVLVTTDNFTLNFNAEISSLLNAVVNNTLYSVYYESYLLNLFNLKNRETTVKTNLPISLLTNLELNDRLVIRDKRYMINDMKSNLTTGEVSFTLLNDFSDVISQGGAEPIEPLQPSDGAQCLDVRILFPNGAVSAAITTTDAGVTITPSTLTTDGTVNVCIPANTDTIGLIVTEDDANYINTENFLRLRTEEGNVAIYTLTVTYTYADGTTVANQILIQQQP